MGIISNYCPFGRLLWLKRGTTRAVNCRVQDGRDFLFIQTFKWKLAVTQRQESCAIKAHSDQLVVLAGPDGGDPAERDARTDSSQKSFP